MKLKNIFLAASLALCATSAYAVDAKDLRVYINPGHGAFDSGSRPMGTVKHGANNAYNDVNNDTTNFFESNTNLNKGLALFYKLKEMGLQHNGANALDLTQNIVMSRIESGAYPPYLDYDNHTVNPESSKYDRSLYEISAEVEFNNFDLFVSIHSNAATEGTSTNYPLFLYRGTDSQEGNAGSIAVSKACWPHIYGMGHHQWTYYSMTNMNIRGDHSFYGSPGTATYEVPEGYDYLYDETDQFSEFVPATDTTPAYVKYTGYLGVIKHGCTGFLAEGYFHTYQCARHRYMNRDVCYLEGDGYAYGINDYFKLGYEEKEAVIYGIVRDKDFKFSHDYYKPNANSNDKYMPLNGVNVALLNEAGDTVATYVTDDEWNGAFVFHVQPGTYSLAYSLEGYNAPEAEFTAPFTVTAGQKYYPEAFLRDVDWVAPAKVYVNYPDSTAGKADYAVFPSYNMSTKEYSLLSEQLADKKVRRQIVRDGKLYVLALDAANEPYIYLADLAAGTVDTLDMTPVVMGANGKLKISDIALTADHYLVACGLSGVHYGDNIAETDGVERGKVNVYKWKQNETTLLPDSCELWFETDNSANYNRGLLGRTMTYSGTIADGKLTMTNQHGTKTSSIAMRLTQLGIADGQLVTSDYLDAWAGDDEALFYADVMSDCEDYEFMVSPLADKDNLVLDGNLISPFEFTFPETGYGNAPTILGRNTKIAPAVNGANYFKFAGKSLMTAPKVNEEGKLVGIQLFDITGGFDNAVEIAINAAIEPVEFAYASAHGEAELELSSDDITIGAEMVLYLVIDGKVIKFNEKVDNFTSVAGTANPYAFALTSEFADNVLVVNYKLNAPATAVTIYVKDAEENIVVTKEMGAQEADAYTAELSMEGVEAEGTFTWEVEVAGEVKDRVEHFGDYSFWHPRGVDVDNNMESPSFGNIYVAEGQGTTSSAYWSGTGGGIGLYAFAADFTPIKNEVTGKYVFTGGLKMNQKAGTNNAADFNKVRVAEDGRLFLSRLNSSGDYIVYAPSFEELVAKDSVISLYDGLTFDASTYNYTNTDGVYMGAANLCFAIKGSGEDLQLAALSSNSTHWAAVYTGVTSELYKLGTASTLPVPEVIEPLNQRYTIFPQTTNIDFDKEGGLWYCQYRGAPTDAQPGLVYINAEGKETYKDLVSRGGGGVRVSPDGKQIAIASSSTNPKQFTIYNIVMNDGVPALQPVMVITHGIGTNFYDVAWDLAGNLYGVSNSGELVRGFALPREEAFTTKAASRYAFEYAPFKQSHLPDFAPVSEMTVTKVWESNEGIPAAAYGAYRFGSGVDDDVLTTTASHQIEAIDAAGKRVLADLTAFFEATPELHVVNTVIEKIDTISVDTAYNETETGTDTVVTVLADTTWAEVKTLDAMGTAITVDDAGNIIVNVGFPSTTSSSEFIIVPADGSEYRFMSLDLASISSANARVDQVGRVIGDVLSAEGAYMWLNPNGATQVPVIKIKEGAMVADESQVADISDLKNSTSCLAQPAIFNVADIDAMMEEDADISATFWWRNRSTAGVVNGWQYNDSEGMYKFDKTVTVSKGAASNEGFATFNLQGNTYFVVPTTSGSARTAEFVITDVEGNVLYTLGSTAAAKDQYGALAAYELDDNTAIIYHLLP
ncbi:MAG: hypothetical protein IKZ14_00885, partial [Muribaculaceae bacterium]|nr:hypothetical protein [Muribaculaceae bacterium]